MKLCMNLKNLLHILALDIEDEHKRKAYVKFSNRWQARGYRVSVLKDVEAGAPFFSGALLADLTGSDGERVGAGITLLPVE